jgi:hypothetical protein
VDQDAGDACEPARVREVVPYPEGALTWWAILGSNQ